jgi:hypothetical protein
MKTHPQQASRQAAQSPTGILLLAVALLWIAPADPAHAAAPPVGLPEQPAPGPLFNGDDFHADPVRLALAVLAGSSSPTGPFSAAAVLSAGDHPAVRAWQLGGVLTNRYTRRSCGASSLCLSGFAGQVPGLGAFNALATLTVGHYLDCWALRDTDRFHALPKEWLEAINDNRGFTVGGLEAEVYSRVLVLSNYTSNKAFHQALQADIGYTHVFNFPDENRGKVVAIEGKLKRVNRFPPPPEAAAAGVCDLYEAWIFSEKLTTNPYCAVFTEWPAGLPRGLLGKESIKGEYTVRMDGYFFKKFRYKARPGSDGKLIERDAPLFIGHSLVYLGKDIPPEKRDNTWLNSLVYGIVGVFGTALAAVVGLTWWFRQSDNKVRKRLLQVRSPEFVLPPPDAMPVATPVGPGSSSHGNVRPLPPRISFRTGSSGDRGGEPPDEGGKRGSGDAPPEEGAGA